MSFTEIYAMPFMRWALIAAVLSAATLGYLGIFIILRRIVFLGAALPQFAALGLAGALLTGVSPILGAAVGAIGCVGILAMIPSRGRIPFDGAIGIAFAVASSCAILLFARSAEGEIHIFRILSGDILGATPTEISILGIVFALISVTHYATWKELLLVSYDPEMATALGLNVRAWNALLFFTIGLAVALATRVSGAIVSFSFLVGPASAALLISRKFSAIVPIAISFGALSAFLGLTLSFIFETPSGPTIAACELLPTFVIVFARLSIRRWRL